MPYTLTERVNKKLDELEKERIITKLASSDRGPTLTSIIKYEIGVSKHVNIIFKRTAMRLNNKVYNPK
uniref:Uncharacterized protein n=1 Tax=Glossina morsitans morsitans TaxID=37546 RepID=A0A1B0G5M6_GLOMM